MEFRYREMVYRPDYYDFHNDDREEWYPNGIFIVNDINNFTLNP